ncbi:hypothetical protein QNH14_03485 [Apirhabdus apintestini]|nr:hypothetical protein QNH14_03485 [Enterobacteriaceae bacterium CA-0114]
MIRSTPFIFGFRHRVAYRAQIALGAAYRVAQGSARCIMKMWR